MQICCLIKQLTEFCACGSRYFGPAGPTFFSLVGKEGKSTPRGKGTLSNGSPSPLEPPTLRNDQKGASAPFWISPQRRLVHSDVAAGPTLHGIVCRDARMGERSLQEGIQRGPEGPSLVGGERCRRGGIRTAQPLAALPLRAAASSLRGLPPSPVGVFAFFWRCCQKKVAPAGAKLLLDKSGQSCIIRI